MAPDDFQNVITTADELRALVGTPSELVQHKAITHLDAHCTDFIGRSPLLFISSADASGRCDVSPRGDAPGFVQVLSPQRLLIPERPGNKRLDTLRNILEHPGVGLVFLIPGLGEALRVNGTAKLVRDEALLRRMEAQGKVPLLAITVEVEECYLHCGKAFKRAQLWSPESWPDPATLPRAAAILSDHASTVRMTEPEVALLLQESYTKRLY
ncbi:pyridoxamine 5'-phosphate oxidase family protein [Flaviaesturariibacter amylovorans]|uniref:Pyridoxamine 5'-phosphate oxidase family protein n=1 Tax=Flaviaesturariibacter amylovorans TaxID=1084520 RepID=A0ABP8GZQ2_9BACT